DRLPAEERDRVRAAYTAALESQQDCLQMTYRFQMKDGASRLIES
ncbi:Sensory box/GGDEF domain/EAL domain-containing protein, partial [Pseudomonas syringae pv. primulae]